MVKFSSVATNAITLLKIKSYYSAFLRKDISLRLLTIIKLQRGSLPSVLECTELIRLTRPKRIFCEHGMDNEKIEEI